VALARDGRERVIGVLDGRQEVAVTLSTDADETLEVRSNAPEISAVPIVAQRWVLPFAALALDDEPAQLGAAAGLVGLRDYDGTTTVIDVGVDGGLRTRPLESGGVAPRALLRSRDLRHVGGCTCPEDQIAKASPANATASRRVAGSSTASS
jgi:hypothetical protein